MYLLTNVITMLMIPMQQPMFRVVASTQMRMRN